MSNIRSRKEIFESQYKSAGSYEAAKTDPKHKKKMDWVEETFKAQYESESGSEDEVEPKKVEVSDSEQTTRRNLAELEKILDSLREKQQSIARQIEDVDKQIKGVGAILETTKRGVTSVLEELGERRLKRECLTE